MIPFSLLWGGFAIFWVAGASYSWGKHSNGQWLFALWGIPFVAIGQYLIWGRFVYAAWLKRRTYYAVTNRRVLVIQDGWKRQVASAYIDSLPSLSKEGGTNGTGILRFGPEQNMWSNNRSWQDWNALSITGRPTFVDIDDVDSVYRLVSDLRERSRASKPTGLIPLPGSRSFAGPAKVSNVATFNSHFLVSQSRRLSKSNSFCLS